MINSFYKNSESRAKVTDEMNQMHLMTLIEIINQLERKEEEHEVIVIGNDHSTNS